MHLERANIVKLLIENGKNAAQQIAQIEKNLHDYRMGIAVHPGVSSAQYIKRMAKNVDNFNAVDKNGNNALHIAIVKGDNFK